MKTQRIKFEKQVVMALTSILLLGSGCESRIDTRGNSSVGEGTPVDVTFRIGLADETDAYTLSATPESKALAPASVVPSFGYALCPSAGTKAATALKPAALYNLEIRQYRNSDGVCIGGSGTVAEEVSTGSLITATLQAATKCHLVLVAWGKENTADRLETVPFSKAQAKNISNTYITGLDPTKQEDMNKMPYMLHLENVNVSDDGRIYSADGEAIDVRLLLRRLAARLTVDWTYDVQISGSAYKLSRILLQSVPLNYNVIPAPDASSGNTYPSLLDQFTTIQLKDTELQSGGFSYWLPANVRGTSPEATSLFYRYKKNAPIGSTFIEFQAINQSNAKQKLNYRVYLGENTSTDFNLHANTDYKYTVNIKHTELPNNDQRVTIVDPIAASENNTNFVPTANCFLIAPGGAFYFNPYNYYRQGKTEENGLLKSWCPGATRIKSVRVLWQTKEDGDIGDPVLGVVNDATDHTNVVDLQNGDSFTDARIYCRIAPNTSGGSAVIAAYDDAGGKGNILWSWHLWITEYAPDATLNETVLEPANKRILKFTINSANQRPMMDRNLGAKAGYIDRAPEQEIDRSKANGFHYQWGRKDLYPSSYTNDKNQTNIFITSDTEPTHGIMNLYGADGIAYIPYLVKVETASYQKAYQNPLILYFRPDDSTSKRWLDASETNFSANWTNKTVHDPCPAGWRIPLSREFTPLKTKQNSSPVNDGGVLSYFDAAKQHSTYLRLNGYWRYNKQFDFINSKTLIWSGDDTSDKAGYSSGQGGSYWVVDYYSGSSIAGNVITTGHEIAALNLRCIQE